MTKFNKKVSVIIPAYNASSFIGQAIDSILGQTYQDIEIIVVDDGSADATKDIVAQYGDRVTYIYQENQGHAISRNVGMKNSMGEYCAFLDADDQWLPEKIERQVKVLNERPEVGIVHCDIKKVDADGNFIPKYKENEKYKTGDIFPYLLTRKGHIATSSAIFRRECVEKLGGFDETVREFGSEDREFWLRICKHYKVVHVEDPLVVYRHLTKSLSRSRKLDNIIKGRRWAINKSLKGFTPSLYGWYLKRIAYSAIYKDLGYAFLADSDFQAARVYYLRAIRSWFFDIALWVGLARALLKIKNRSSYV